MLSFFIKGIVLGFSIAAPVGPIGVLCINRTLEKNKLHGFVSGLGAATADSLYGLIAALGLTAITSFLLDYNFYIKVFGLIFLLYLAFTIFMKKTTTFKPSTIHLTNPGSLAKDYISILFLTITNPMTILSFLAMFSSILGKVDSSVSKFSSMFIVAGVFIGSAIWWFILSFITSILKTKMNEKHLLYINKFSALILFGFSLFIAKDLIKF